MKIKDYIEINKTKKQKITKPIIKKGTLDIGIVEVTPLVFNDRFYRFEWIRPTNIGGGYYGNTKEYGYFRFVDMETEEVTPSFAYDHSFGSAYTEDGIMYAMGVEGREAGGNKLNIFYSDNLFDWKIKTAIEFPEDWKVYNTSICKGKDMYVMAVEIGGPKHISGNGFAIVFSYSYNMMEWQLFDVDSYIFDRERYTGCPVIKYSKNHYYMIYLENLFGYRFVPYIVRSKNLIEWEMGVKNPVMWFSDEDKTVQRPEKFTKQQLDHIKYAVNINNGDLDLCEWQGKTVILYSWGNQLGKEFLAEAQYDGDLDEFLKSFF